MNIELEKIISELREVFKKAFQLALESDIGINNKVGFNTLVDSNLYNEVEVKNNEFSFQIYYNFYADFVISGRKPFTTKVPIKVIIDWMRRKHIGNGDNSIAYAIRESIYQEGIKGRNFFPIFESNIDEAMENYFDKIFESIITSLNNFFND